MTDETNHPEDLYPLSPMQWGMLVETLRLEGAGVCFEQDIYRLDGTMDLERFTRAWQKAIDQHPVLRTSFLWEDIEEPHQIVHREGTLSLHHDDWRGTGEPEQHRRLEAYLRTERQRGFELTRLPLMRLGLFRTADSTHWLVWNFHHAILDGWSLPIVLRDVLAHYGASAQASGPRPYREHVAWLLSQNLDVAEAYWRRTLKQFPSPTPLTVDRRVSPGEAVDDATFHQTAVWLSRESTALIHSFARSQRVTINTIIQGAWGLLLGRYASVDEVVVGCNLSVRPPSVPGADQIVGLCLNTLPLRIPTAPGLRVGEWLAGVQAKLVELQEYGFSPLTRIQQWSEVPAGLKLFESIVVFENYPQDFASEETRAGLKVSYESWQRHSKTGYPLTLLALPGDRLRAEIKYDSRRFDEVMVSRMLGHFVHVLENLVRTPEAFLRDIPLLNPKERAEMLNAMNRPGAAILRRHIPVDGASTLQDLFEAQVARRPDAIALKDERQALTYRQLNRQANRVARRLRQLGVGPDVLVGVCVERTNALVVALISILKAGGAYLPIDLAYPADRLVFMLDDARSPVLLTQSSLAGKLPSTAAQVVTIDSLLAEAEQASDDENLPVLAAPDHLAYVIYTSGTTGKPKGSEITHRNVVRLFSCTDPWYGFNESDVWTLFHSCAFDFSVWEIWGALLYGGRVVVVPYLTARSPETFYALLAQEGVTVLNQTPSAFRQLIQAEDAVGVKDLSLRYVIFGGEALEMQSLRPWFVRHGDQRPHLINMYGITETTVHVTYRPLSADDVDGGSVIGMPIPDLQVYVLDGRREPVPFGVPGEMYVGGAGLARGYLNRPELSAERFVPDTVTGHPNARLYRTGDLAKILPAGDIEYLGRIDQQVKIRGFRIELGEIESVLCEHPSVREAIVLARTAGIAGPTLVGYIVPAASAGLAARDMRDHLRKKVPDYMVPAAFVFLDRLPLTENGKVDRAGLPNPAEQRDETPGVFVAPQGEMETLIAGLWAEVLQIARVSTEENLFDLGAHSMLVVQMHVRLRAALQRDFPLLDLFQFPTVRALAKHLERAEAETERVSPDVRDRAQRQREAMGRLRSRGRGGNG